MYKCKYCQTQHAKISELYKCERHHAELDGLITIQYGKTDLYPTQIEILFIDQYGKSKVIPYNRERRTSWLRNLLKCLKLIKH